MTLTFDNDVLTVTRGTTVGLTVTRGASATFSVLGRVGNLIANALLAEDGSAILTESGDLILF